MQWEIHNTTDTALISDPEVLINWAHSSTQSVEQLKDNFFKKLQSLRGCKRIRLSMDQQDTFSRDLTWDLTWDLIWDFEDVEKLW